MEKHSLSVMLRYIKKALTMRRICLFCVLITDFMLYMVKSIVLKE